MKHPRTLIYSRGELSRRANLFSARSKSRPDESDRAVENEIVMQTDIHQPRKLSEVLAAFRRHAQDIAFELDIDAIDAEKHIVGEPSPSQVAFAVAAEELGAHAEGISAEKRELVLRVLTEVKSESGRHPRVAEAISKLRKRF